MKILIGYVGMALGVATFFCGSMILLLGVLCLDDCVFALLNPVLRFINGNDPAFAMVLGIFIGPAVLGIGSFWAFPNWWARKEAETVAEAAPCHVNVLIGVAGACDWCKPWYSWHTFRCTFEDADTGETLAEHIICQSCWDRWVQTVNAYGSGLGRVELVSA